MHYFASASLAVATIATFTNAVTLDNVFKRDAALEVTLEKVQNSIVKAVVKNVGAKPLNLMTYGSIFDKAPVQKLDVTSAGSKVAFEGVLRRVKTTGLSADVFYLLEAGATYETTIDAATVHTLKTGAYSVTAEGALPYAEVGSTELSGGAVYFKSNTLDLQVDGAAAKMVKKAIPVLSERTVLQSDCSSSQQSATSNALSNCVSLASQAATAARSGSSSKFSEYFKTTSSSVRNTVAARLSAVANECSSLSSGATQYYCTDVYNYCGSNVLAYTIPSQNVVVNCPLYYSDLPNLTGSCHAQDQTTTTIHEMTHAPGTYSPGTQDNGYGYAAATALSSSAAVLNADSYALYSNAIYVGC